MHIEPSKEERIKGVLPKLDSSLVRLMPSSVIEAANSTIHKIFTHDTINEDSPTPCYMVRLKIVFGTYQTFTDKER